MLFNLSLSIFQESGEIVAYPNDANDFYSNLHNIAWKI